MCVDVEEVIALVFIKRVKREWWIFNHLYWCGVSLQFLRVNNVLYLVQNERAEVIRETAIEMNVHCAAPALLWQQ